MDWSAFQAVALMMPSDFMQPPRLEEALEFLKGPEFVPTVPAPVSADRGRPVISTFDHFGETGKFFAPPRLCVERRSRFERSCRIRGCVHWSSTGGPLPFPDRITVGFARILSRSDAGPL